MPSPRLLVANSIGLTGAEILIAALATHPAIAMLPGQNFIGFDGCLYRDRSYAALAPAQIFERLAAEYAMTSGRIWSGLTKNMSEAERARYDRARHREAFMRRAPGRRGVAARLRGAVRRRVFRGDGARRRAGPLPGLLRPEPGPQPCGGARRAR